jgi:hypothetical protein
MANNLLLKLVTPKVLRFALVLSVVLVFAARGQAKNNCPWMNEATSSGLLGGDAVGEFTDVAPGKPASCLFTQAGPNFTRTLRITVEVTPDTHMHFETAAQACTKTASPLEAIGNEASMCTLESRNSGLTQLVVGRVRDQLFTITFSTTLKEDPILTRMSLKEKAYTAAEQVAGNLF